MSEPLNLWRTLMDDQCAYCGGVFTDHAQTGYCDGCTATLLHCTEEERAADPAMAAEYAHLTAALD